MPIRLLNRRISCFTLHQATPLRCDVIVGCEDGLLGCIMGCGGTSVRCDHAASDDRAAKETSSHGHHSAAHPTAGPADLEAHASAAAVLERMICVATSDDFALQSEDAAEAAATAAAAVAAAEACDAGVFRAVRVHDAAVLCAGFMPYDSRVVFMSGGADGRLVMCSSSTSLQPHAVAAAAVAHRGWVTCMACSSTGTCYTGGIDGFIKAWRPHRSATSVLELMPMHSVPAHGATVNDLTFANDGAHLLSVSSDCTLRVASLPKIQTSELLLQGFRSKLSAALVCRGAIIIAAAVSLDSIEFSSGREVFSVPVKSPCCCASALPSGDRLVAIGHADGSVSVRLTDTGAALHVIECGRAPVLMCMSMGSLLLLQDGAGSLVFRSLSDVALACVNHPLRSTTMPAARRCLQQCVTDSSGLAWAAHQKSGSRSTLVAVSSVAAADELSIDWKESVSGNALMSLLFMCRWFSTEASLLSLHSLPDLLIDDSSFPLSAPVTNGVITVKEIKEFAKQWRIMIPKDLRTLSEILDFVNERVRDTRAESLLQPHFDWPLHIPHAAAAAIDKCVDVSNTRLLLLPAELLKLQGLTQLNVSSCSLKFVPSSIRHAHRLLHFSACNNQIQNVPEEFRFCPALQTLHMSNNTVQFLPPGISQLNCLTQLWLSSNNLRSLREEVASLSSLTDLRISSNSFREWPAVLGQLTRLVHLDASRCTFRQLPATAVKGIVGLQRLSSLQHLDLSLCALVAPPPAGYLPLSLTTLYLAANPFDVRAPALQLPLLCALDCRCCGAFPCEVASLPQLQTLGCSAPFDVGWHAVVQHTPAAVAAAPVTSTESVAVGDGAAVGGAAVVSAAAAVDGDAAAAAVGGDAAAVPYVSAPPASSACEEVPAHSEAVLKMLANDIATPTRGLTWKIYCRK